MTRRGTQTLYELVDMIGDSAARDCYDRRLGRAFDKAKRKYGRMSLD
jgi:hypothetical protein